jgi:hypothetical protein
MGDLKNWNNVKPPAPTPPANVTGDLMHFIQVKNGGTAIAGSNGQTKNIYGNPEEYNTAVWCAAVSGAKNPTEVILVSKKYWDSLPTVG